MQIRRTIGVAPKVGRVTGIGIDKDFLNDRRLNGESFPGEYLARIPRRKAKYLRDNYLLGFPTLVRAVLRNEEF